MRVTDEVERGAWLRDRLGEWGSVGGVVGTGWEAIARISHPDRDEHPTVGALPFPTLARIVGHLGAGPVTAAFWDGWGDWRPGGASFVGVATDGGPLTDEKMAEIRARARREHIAALDPALARAAERGPFLDLPHRRYFLVDARLDEFADPKWATTNRFGWHTRQTPTLLWPADRTWVLGTEIDATASEVAGPRILIDALREDDTLRTEEVSLDDPVTYAW